MSIVAHRLAPILDWIPILLIGFTLAMPVTR